MRKHGGEMLTDNMRKLYTEGWRTAEEEVASAVVVKVK